VTSQWKKVDNIYEHFKENEDKKTEWKNLRIITRPLNKIYTNYINMPICLDNITMITLFYNVIIYYTNHVLTK